MLTAAKPAGRYYLLRDRESGKTLALGADPTVRRLDALAYRRDE